jgi:hypothetical protein
MCKLHALKQGGELLLESGRPKMNAIRSPLRRNDGVSAADSASRFRAELAESVSVAFGLFASASMCPPGST